MLDEHGSEILDTTPVAIPLKFNTPPTRIDEMRYLMSMVSRQAAEAGQETLEESNDFNVGDDFDPVSDHEFSEQEELADQALIASGPPLSELVVTPPSPLPGVLTPSVGIT